MRGIIIAVILTIVVVATECDETVFVAEVKQNFHNDETIDIQGKLNDQINLELHASYIYNGYATYFQRADVHLPGFQAFFAKASLEERQHANMLMKYVNNRGGQVKLDIINMGEACGTVANAVQEAHKRDSKSQTGEKFCICKFVSSTDLLSTNANKPDPCKDYDDRSDWKEGLMAMEDALAMERHVNSKLLKLHTAAEKDGDPHLSHFLEHEMLEEQVNSIYELGGYVTRLRKFKDNYKLGEYLFDQKLE